MLSSEINEFKLDAMSIITLIYMGQGQVAYSVPLYFFYLVNDIIVSITAHSIKYKKP